MTDIVVFTSPETVDVQLNKTEQEIMYDNFIKTKSLDVHHYPTFMEMENLKKSELITKSTIPSITIKKILQYCTPIIKDVPLFSVKTEKVDIFKKKKIAVRTSEYFNISTQLENDIICKFIDDNMIEKHARNNTMVVPKHTNFKIIGVIIPKIITKDYNTTTVNFFKCQKIIDLLTSGNFGLTEFQSQLFIQSFIKKLKPAQHDDTRIYFKNYEDSLLQIEVIYEYIKYVQEYYKKNLVMVYQYLYNKPFTEHIKNQKKWYNTFNPSLNKPLIFEKPNAVLNRISELINVSSADSNLANAFVMEKYDVYDIYKKIMMLGESSTISKLLFHELKNKQIILQRQIKYKKEKFLTNLEFAKKKAISINKFNIYDVSKLSTSQKKVVELEFIKLEKFYENAKKNKEDFDLVRSLIWANENGRKKLIEYRLKELMTKIKLPKNADISLLTEMVKSTSSVNLVCPHVLARANKLIEPVKSDLHQSGEIRQYLINNFSLPKVVDGYYCKICGQLLADADDESVVQFIAGKRVSQFIEHDRLRVLIWKECAHIITSYVKFKESVNYKNIINSITNALRGEMGSLESTLIKIKSNSKDGIKDLMGVYVCIYIFSIVVHMISNNYGHITFSMRPSKQGGCGEKYGGNAPKNGKIVQNILNNALYLILRIKNVALNNLSSIKPESVKPILIKAYKWSAKLQTSKIKSDIDETTDKSELYKDPVYVYAQYVYMQTQYKKNKADSKAKVKDILGRTWETVENEFAQNISMYATLNEFEDWGDSHKYGSYKKIHSYVSKKMYSQTAQPYSSILQDHDDEFSHLLVEDDKRNNEYTYSEARPYTNINLLDNFMLKFNDFRPHKIHIDKYYDNNGDKHVFNIYVYQYANNRGVLNGTKKEFTKEDRIELLKSHDDKHYQMFQNMYMVDLRCSKCKVLWSQTKNKTVERSLMKKENKGLFYKYYENKCPKGELHIYKLVKNTQSCSKCGITSYDINTHSDKYYRKFLSVFEKSHKKKSQLNKKEIDKLIYKKKERVVIKTFPKWKIDNSDILQISRIFKIKYNVWINLGLTINHNFVHIEKDKINPSININQSTSNLRNLQLRNYYLRVVKFLHTIKNYDIIDFVPYDLKNIMQKNKVRDLDKKLINSNSNILLMYNYYKSHELPSVVSNFLLYQISNTLLKLFKSMKQHNMSVASDLIKYIINEIIKSERLLSTPNLAEFSTTIFKTNTAEVDGTVLSNDDNVIVDDMSSADDVKDIYEQSDDDANDDIFNTGDLDMASGEDAELNADF